MFHVDKWGIGKVVEMALDHVNKERNRPIHLSFDVDALDPSVAPSTGTAVSLCELSRAEVVLTACLLRPGSWRSHLPRGSLHLQIGRASCRERVS